MMTTWLLLCLFLVALLFGRPSTPLLSIMLLLEFLVVVAFAGLVLLPVTYFALVFMVIAACESAVGLACLVGVVRRSRGPPMLFSA